MFAHMFVSLLFTVSWLDGGLWNVPEAFALAGDRPGASLYYNR